MPPPWRSIHLPSFALQIDGAKRMLAWTPLGSRHDALRAHAHSTEVLEVWADACSAAGLGVERLGDELVNVPKPMGSADPGGGAAAAAASGPVVPAAPPRPPGPGPGPVPAAVLSAVGDAQTHYPSICSGELQMAAEILMQAESDGEQNI